MREATADAVVRVSPTAGGPVENGAFHEKGNLSGHLSKRWSNRKVGPELFDWTGLFHTDLALTAYLPVS